MANAGSYKVTYSGGTATWADLSTTGTNSNTAHPYFPGDDGSYGGYGVAQWLSGEDAVTSGSAKCEGEITATFTWQPSSSEDLPPADILIVEEGSTSVDSPANSGATGTSDNDLGFTFVHSPSYPNSANGTSSGTRYQTKLNPGQRFTLTCSPSANVEGAGVPNKEGSYAADVVVVYKATALPLGIVLSGGIGTGDNKRFLVGQQVTGTLSTGGLDASGFRWDVSGNEPFKRWTPTDAPNTGTTFVGYSGDRTSPTLFCFRKYTGSKALVVCSCHLTVPPGAKPSSGLDILLIRQCYVDKPSNTLAVYIGSVQGIVASRTPGPKPSAMQLVEAYDPNAPNFLSGILWDGAVTTPSQYSSVYGIGGWNYTQLITPNRLVRIGNVDYRPLFQGRQVLDAAFGYNSISEQNQNLYGANGIPAYEGDSPSQPFCGGSYTEVLDSFVTYTLYKPPGAGSQYVPLKNLEWFWKGQAQRDMSGDYQVSNTSAMWSFKNDFPEHPMWPDTEPTNPVPFSPPLP